MDVVHDAGALLDRLAAVSWPALFLALGLHLGKRASRARAWQNVVQAAYPGSLPYGTAFGASLAALGVAALAPIRGGELVRVAIVRRRIPGSSSAALGATLAVETAVDAVIGGLVVLASLAGGLLPGLGAMAVFGPAGRSLRSLRGRFALGLAVVGDRGALCRGVLSWLALSWLLRLASAYAFLAAFAIDPSLGLALVVLASQCLAALLPLTWLGIGAQHGLLVAVLAGSAGAGEAIAFGLGMQAATLLVNLAAGGAALILLTRTLRWRSLAASLRLT